MSKLTSNVYEIAYFLLAGTEIVYDFEHIKSVVLFIGALFLLFLRARLYWIRIKKEKDNKELKKN